MKLKSPKSGTKPSFEFEFPEGFILVVDTREQNQLFKRPLKGLVLVRDKLEVGDYSIRGFESLITIERKNLNDLYMSCGRERENFKQRLEKMKNYERKWLLIEATESDVLSWQEFSQLHPNVVRGMLASIEVRYGIPVHYEPNRHNCERWILDRFLKYFRLKRKGEL